MSCTFNERNFKIMLRRKFRMLFRKFNNSRKNRETGNTRIIQKFNLLIVENVQ